MLGFNINTVCWLDHWTPHIVCASVSLEKPLLDETIFIVVVTCCHVLLWKQFGVLWPCTFLVLCIWSMYDAYMCIKLWKHKHTLHEFLLVILTVHVMFTLIRNNSIHFGYAFSGKTMLNFRTKVAINCWDMKCPDFLKKMVQQCLKGNILFL